MIQINLLPDVKLEYLRARRMRNLVISGAVIAGLASAGVVVLLLLFLGVQAGREVIADNGIEREYEKLSQVENLSELVTLQNQLDVIGSQHLTKTVNSRLFSVIQGVNPSGSDKVQYTTVVIDPIAKTLEIEGVARGGYAAVETFKKTIDNTDIEFVRDQVQATEDIATNVSIGETSFGESSGGDRVLQFKVTVTYNELLFSNQAGSMRIITPERRIDVTDSKAGVPNSLFTTPPKEEGAE